MASFLRSTGILIICIFIWPGTLQAEPLRIVVPAFFGPEPINQHVRTTLYFEIVKGLRGLDASEKGAWVIYGQKHVEKPTHDAILDSITWPSVRGDLALWGKVHAFDDGVVVQLHLSLTPLLKRRAVRPELWRVSLRNSVGKQTTIELDIPGQFYSFEPLLLTRETILRFSTPQGIGIFSSRHDGMQVGTVSDGVIYFSEFRDDALFIENNGKKGWVRTPPITTKESEALAFSTGMIRLLRGDWRGARQRFEVVLANQNVPQELRIYALMYVGLAKEKGGEISRNEFEMAYNLNPLSRSAAAYLLMGQLAEISRLQEPGGSIALKKAWKHLNQTIDKCRPLFSLDDLWFSDVDKAFH